MSLSILVVGGGIAGLCAAGLLARLGHRVRLIERSPAWAPVGAGIVLQPNASAILQALGIAVPGHLRMSLPGFRVMGRSGKTLMAALAPEQGIPETWAFHRADLHQVLLSALPQGPSGVHVELGRFLHGLHPPFAPHEPVLVSIGRSNGEEPELARFDVVIGADGLRSRTRAALAGPADPPLRYSGQTCWRIAAQLAPGSPHWPTSPTEQWFGERRLGIVPLSGGRLYAFFVASAPEGQDGSGGLARLRADFGGLSPEVDGLLGALPADTAVHHADLLELSEHHPGQGRIVLIGDAAHAMTPNLGQGAGMGIEDAAALGLLLVSGTSPDELAAALAKKRQARVRTIADTARRLGELAHLQGPLVPLRDFALGLMPSSMARKQVLDGYAPGLRLAEALARLAPTPLLPLAV